ncbi:hypothetical protein Adt_23611 [Abeliophyllum distichum]|uniref:Uncharacterized protein n=1 Tax=Abeliophyllum distichum TaxID=126358 RepID=A0ABD1SC64_9LAMI
MPKPRPSEFQYHHYLQPPYHHHRRDTSQDSAKSQPISFLPPKEASTRCLGLPLGTRPNLILSPSFLPKKHRLAAWPFHLGLGQIAAYLLPSFQGNIASLLGPPTRDSAKSQPISFHSPKGASPRCLALPPGTRPNHSLSPFFLPKKHRLVAWPSHLGLGQIAAYLITSSQGSIASLLGPSTRDSAKSQLNSFLPPKKASPRCLAFPPGTRPNRSLSLSFQ